MALRQHRRQRASPSDDGYFAAEAILASDDPRFQGKGLGIRNAIIIGTWSLVFPALHAAGRRPWAEYRWWTDALWLSVPWLDMLGNSLNLYDTYTSFDLIPHTHGPGAITVVLMEGLRMPFLGAVGVAQIGHMLLEAQEYYTDLFLGTDNVAGVTDVINDLLVGVVGSLGYGALYHRLRHGSWWPGWR